MYPTVEDVVRIRLMIRALLRLVGVIIALFCVGPVSSWLIEGISDGDLLSFYYYGTRIIMGLTAIVLGAIVFFAARPIARLLVPMRHETDCPACRYPLAGFRAERCPECGLRLPAGFSGESDDESLEASRRKTLEQASNAGFASTLGFVLIIGGAVGVFLGCSWGGIELISGEYGFGLILLSLIAGGGTIATGAWLLAWSDRKRRAGQRLKVSKPVPPLSSPVTQQSLSQASVAD